MNPIGLSLIEEGFFMCERRQLLQNSPALQEPIFRDPVEAFEEEILGNPEPFTLVRRLSVFRVTREVRFAETKPLAEPIPQLDEPEPFRVSVRIIKAPRQVSPDSVLRLIKEKASCVPNLVMLGHAIPGLSPEVTQGLEVRQRGDSEEDENQKKKETLISSIDELATLTLRLCKPLENEKDPIKRLLQALNPSSSSDAKIKKPSRSEEKELIDAADRAFLALNKMPTTAMTESDIDENILVRGKGLMRSLKTRKFGLAVRLSIEIQRLVESYDAQKKGWWLNQGNSEQIRSGDWAKIRWEKNSRPRSFYEPGEYLRIREVRGDGTIRVIDPNKPKRKIPPVPLSMVTAKISNRDHRARQKTVDWNRDWGEGD